MMIRTRIWLSLACTISGNHRDAHADVAVKPATRKPPLSDAEIQHLHDQPATLAALK